MCVEGERKASIRMACSKDAREMYSRAQREDTFKEAPKELEIYFKLQQL